MAKVMVKKFGGEKSKVDANTVADVLESGYTATVNGNAASPDQKLEDGDFIVLSKQVKGNGRPKKEVKNPLLYLKGVIVKKEGVNYVINGEKLTKGQAEKLAEALLADMGWTLK